jgi:diaminobutyrate-2-oxoglutarate transaminase
MQITENFEQFNYTEAPKIFTKLPGARASELLARLANVDQLKQPRAAPADRTVWQSGKGATLRDVDQNLFIDTNAGTAVLFVGHCNPYVVNALKEQASALWTEQMAPSQVRVELEEKLFEIAPGDLKRNSRVMLCTGSGTDAIEAAVKLAKYVTRKEGIIAFHGSYHGTSHAALALTSNVRLQNGINGLMPGVFRAPFPYAYRCPFHNTKDYCETCVEECLHYIDQLFKDPHSGLPETAAVLVEPYQGEGGYILPGKGFLSGLRRICTENNVLLIFDEVQTGFGRTGKMFACEHENVTPDILVLGKSIGGGFPFSAIVTKRDIFDNLKSRVHIGTFRANHLGCATSLAAIKFIEDYNLVERAKILGEGFKKRFEELAQKRKFIGDVRGQGLFVGVELVKDKTTKEISEKLADDVVVRMLQKGVLNFPIGHWRNTLRLVPSGVITEELLNRAVEVIDSSLEETERAAK